LPASARPGEWAHVDLEPAALIGTIGDPSAIRREVRGHFRIRSSDKHLGLTQPRTRGVAFEGCGENVVLASRGMEGEPLPIGRKPWGAINPLEPWQERLRLSRAIQRPYRHAHLHGTAWQVHEYPGLREIEIAGRPAGAADILQDRNGRPGDRQFAGVER